MDFFDKVGKTVTQTGQEIGKRAKELAEIARLKNMVHTCEKVVEKNYIAIGKAYYEANGENTDCQFADECEAIRDAKAAIEDLKEQIGTVGMEDL